ncbi:MULTISPECIES: hypothetical protein [unclassified Rhizobium]|uniref:hypothetical protein n=1 Tax=unclassified Rhizobium TaxID=2613769 RepID=UPI001612B1D3|nr:MULTISPECIES: hypothetical protein [unclassified Rhizobium]MBB3318840.1 hypothetical protein [Rhizobium sp. BK181]MCS3742388.1 hypothetical protein [Rhizobium sp. BK661]MCS4094784.1 hypothetical protein [Rhizobium sp. BK176]
MSAADWGTFLSGVFAPIAFIWLVAAVWIQSQELAEQREELRLTRLEFEENREVMRQQAEEAKKQAEFVGMQTSILKHQEEDRVIAQMRGDFSELVRELAGLISQHFKDVGIVEGTSASGRRAASVYQGLGVEEKILISFCKHLADNPANRGLMPPYAFVPAILDKAKAADALAARIIALSEELGPIQQSTVARLEIKRLSANIRALLEGNWPLT